MQACRCPLRAVAAAQGMLIEASIRLNWRAMLGVLTRSHRLKLKWSAALSIRLVIGLSPRSD